MTGGGGDAPPHHTPPPPPGPVSGGEFLLQLLQKRPHHYIHQQQASPPQRAPPVLHHHRYDASSRAPPPQSLTHDPAVAAVGPSLAFPQQHWPSNGHELSSQWPHNPSPPQPPHLLGFAQNPPWSLQPGGYPCSDGPLNPNRGPQLHPNQRLSGEYGLRKLGFPGVDARGKNPASQSERKVMFGSFPCEIQSREGSAEINGFSGIPSSKERGLGVGNGSFNGQDRDRHFDAQTRNLGSFERGSSGYRQHNDGFSGRRLTAESDQSSLPSQQPGFLNKLRGGGKVDFWRPRRGFENNLDKKLNGQADFNHRGLTEQLDRPGPPSGSNLHSVSGSDIEESLMNLHNEPITEIGNQPGRGKEDGMKGNDGEDGDDFDDLNEQVESLGLEDSTDGRKELKKRPNSRDRDVRSDTRGRRLLSQRMRNYKSQMECRRDINRLNSSFLAIVESLIPAEEEKAKQQKLLTLLEKLVCKEWPKAQLYLYGSCANSFGVSKSDVDVCLAMEDADIDKSEVLLRLADILQADNLQNVQALTRARVPIVKLMDPDTGISCDICINNVLAVINTKLLRDYAQIDVRLCQLAFIVKHWAKSRGVNETYQGTLSSYAYVIMCIHFLQQRRPAILPCLQEMKTTYSVTVDDVECAFFDQVDELRAFGSENKESISQLVWAFFNYWAYCHDYANEVISVRTGSMVSKRAKDWTRRVGNDRHLICIEDPFEVSHDLGRVVDKYSIKVLREEFERAAHIMQYDPDPCVTLFQPYVSN